MIAQLRTVSTRNPDVPPGFGMHFRHEGGFPMAEFEGALLGTGFIRTKTFRMDSPAPNVSPAEIWTSKGVSTATDARLDTNVDSYLNALTAALTAFATGDTSEAEIWGAFRKYLALTGDEGLVAMAVRDAHTPHPIVAFATVLQMLGIDPSPATASGAKWLLVRCLKDPHPSIRGAALAGLMNLDDSSAVAPIERAAAVEPIESLRSDMVDALSQWAP